MALCTQAQVEQRLQIDFTNSPEAVITELIAAATGHIERVVGRAVEADDYTETFDAPASAHIWLHNTPVNSVATVTVDGTTITSSGYTLEGPSGRLTRTVNSKPKSWSTSKLQTVTVAYNGGYETVPYDIQDICARMVARAFQAGASYAALPSGADGVKQVSLAGSDSVTFMDSVADVSSTQFITDDEISTLLYYRNPDL